jgi:hypothetical protein
MQDETKERITLGSAIDKMLAILDPLDETSRRTAIKAVCEQLRIDLSGFGGQTPVKVPTEGFTQSAASAQTSASRVKDIRSFAQEKVPSSAVERTVLVAYYLTELAPEAEKKEHIGKEDLERYFKQAGFPLPKRPVQALIDARHAGYLDSLGQGKYRLNAVGYNLITHGLPRQSKKRKGGAQGSVKRKRKQARERSRQ